MAYNDVNKKFSWLKEGVGKNGVRKVAADLQNSIWRAKNLKKTVLGVENFSNISTKFRLGKESLGFMMIANEQKENISWRATLPIYCFSKYVHDSS